MKVGQLNEMLDFQKTSTKKHNEVDEESNKKKQIVVEKDGEYASTYMIDGEGKKVLISRVPIETSNESQMGEEDMTSDADLDIAHGRQMYEASIQKRNTKEIMELVEISAGIASKKAYDNY